MALAWKQGKGNISPWTYPSGEMSKLETCAWTRGGTTVATPARLCLRKQLWKPTCLQASYWVPLPATRVCQWPGDFGKYFISFQWSIYKKKKRTLKTIRSQYSRWHVLMCPSRETKASQTALSWKQGRCTAKGRKRLLRTVSKSLAFMLPRTFSALDKGAYGMLNKAS